MRTGKRLRRAASVALVAAMAALPAAAAGEVDRVQVGKPGQNATEGFPLALYTTVELLPEYQAVNAFDGHSRGWEGPAYRSAKRNGGTSKLDWKVTFDRVDSADAMAAKALGGAPWPTVERPSADVPHLVGAREVGSIPAVALLTEAPGTNNAKYESVVAFPLCKGVFAAAKFSLTSPGAAYGADPNDLYMLNGIPARQWNHDHALAGLEQVALVGFLPPGRVTARAAGRTVTGVVRDCRGDAMAGIRVRLLRGARTVAQGTAAANGSFRLRAPGPGVYRVSVGVPVSGNASKPNHVVTRAVAIRVR